jgi:hypothetical protein
MADPYWAAVGDFNGNGKLDIVVSCYTSAALPSAFLSGASLL